jgi:hypothetical protein
MYRMPSIFATSESLQLLKGSLIVTDPNKRFMDVKKMILLE